MVRHEFNIATGESLEINTTPYLVDGAVVLVDEGDDVPDGAMAAPAPDPNTVPQAVTRRQALLALLSIGKLDQIELLIQHAPRAVQIAWEAAGTFERTNPIIAALAPQVGLTESEIDALFVEAGKL